MSPMKTEKVEVIYPGEGFREALERIYGGLPVLKRDLQEK